MNDPRDVTEEIAAGGPDPAATPAPEFSSSAPAGAGQAAGEPPVEAAAPGAGDGADSVTIDTGALVARIAELETALKETEENALRTLAEADNVRKRSQRDVDNARKFALERFVGELLPVKDSMELGVGACDVDGATLASVREGVILTDKMLGAALEKVGVTAIDPTGEVFNPELHQAVSMVPAAEGVAAGHVMTVIQRGYTLNERLVRPAMVIVAQ